MKASDRSRRFRDAERSESRGGGLGLEVGFQLGMACGGGLGFVVANLVGMGSEPWWIIGAGVVIGALLGWLIHRAAK